MQKFDWHSETLSNNTVLTSSYKNTQNVRRYFRTHFGPDFKMNRTFMAWLKEHTGKTLLDAVAEFKKNHH